MSDPVPFGKYLLLSRIAVGGMAEIFLARPARASEKDGEKLVIKRIRPQLSSQSAFVKMFINEAKLAAQLNHENIVQVHDLGKIGESYFIAMEHVFGRDLRRIIAKADETGIPFPLIYALKIASEVCAALSHAHAMRVVHRDITPENVMVTFTGHVKLLDFGIAQQPELATGEVNGKLSYMSPEQCQGLPPDGKSDLFSLGTALYEWVTGFRLFTGQTQVAIFKSITEGTIYPPSYFKADVPAPVQAILMRALQKDPAKRYQSAAEMKADLDAFLDGADFTPTEVHLANFLKQVFQSELEGSQAKISIPALGAEAHTEVTAKTQIPDPPTIDRMPLRPPTEEVLSIPVSREESEQLELAARRNGVTVPKLVKDILVGWLKYR